MSAPAWRAGVSVYLQDADLTLHHGDAATVLATLPDASVDCCVTSPPYFHLRDYNGCAEQIGQEATPAEFVSRLVDAFRQVWRVLRTEGVCWIVMGDSYDARKCLVGAPWRLALALCDEGWILRSEVIWGKRNIVPEGTANDRPTRAHEQVFQFTKQGRYFWDQDAVREPYETWEHSSRYAREYGLDGGRGQAGNTNHTGIHSRPGNPAGRNLRSVWTISSQPTAVAHFATFPEELVRRCLAASCPSGGTVLDPFIGSGTTALVARRLGLHAVGIDASAEYLAIAAKRLQQLSLLGGVE